MPFPKGCPWRYISQATHCKQSWSVIHLIINKNIYISISAFHKFSVSSGIGASSVLQHITTPKHLLHNVISLCCYQPIISVHFRFGCSKPCPNPHTLPLFLLPCPLLGSECDCRTAPSLVVPSVVHPSSGCYFRPLTSKPPASPYHCCHTLFDRPHHPLSVVLSNMSAANHRGRGLWSCLSAISHKF